MSIDRMIPKPGDWCALKDGGENAGDCIQEYESHDGIDGFAEPLDGSEDAQVKETDGSLGEVDGTFVHDLTY